MRLPYLGALLYWRLYLRLIWPILIYCCTLKDWYGVSLHLVLFVPHWSMILIWSLPPFWSICSSLRGCYSWIFPPNLIDLAHLERHYTLIWRQYVVHTHNPSLWCLTKSWHDNVSHIQLFSHPNMIILSILHCLDCESCRLWSHDPLTCSGMIHYWTIYIHMVDANIFSFPCLGSFLIYYIILMRALINTTISKWFFWYVIYLDIRLNPFLCGNRVHFHLSLFPRFLYESFLELLNFKRIANLNIIWNYSSR